jgi:hypothetical protein
MRIACEPMPGFKPNFVVSPLSNPMPKNRKIERPSSRSMMPVMRLRRMSTGSALDAVAVVIVVSSLSGLKIPTRGST